MRRMLDPTKVGGIPSTIEFDKDGNRKVKKNLGVEGKLTLKSLVSASNPDGDITKELGGGGTTEKYNHLIQIFSSTIYIIFNLTTTSNTKITNYNELFSSVGKKNIPVAGYIVHDSKNCIAVSLSLKDSYSFYVGNYDLSDPQIKTTLVGVADITISDTIQ